MLNNPDVKPIEYVIRWLNDNVGVVSVLIFLFSLFLGWVSGIFTSLRRKPKLRIDLKPGPTFCSTFLNGQRFGDFDVHRTAFSLYLNVANIGSAPTSLESVSIGYHWHLKPFSLLWLRYRFFWSWLHHQTVVLDDFHVMIGDNKKIFPSLFQGLKNSGVKPDTYLEVGRSVSGVVYFEQDESWGGYFPSPRRGQARVIVTITDAFGAKHKKRFWIPIVSLDKAKKYNASFGDTLPALRRGPSPETPAGQSEIRDATITTEDTPKDTQ